MLERMTQGLCFTNLHDPRAGMRIIRAKTTSPAFQETAYTIPEVMVAVLVVAIMMICLYGGFSSSFTMTKIAREDLRATQILMQRMETIRLYTWTQLLNTNYVSQSSARCMTR